MCQGGDAQGAEQKAQALLTRAGSPGTVVPALPRLGAELTHAANGAGRDSTSSPPQKPEGNYLQPELLGITETSRIV